MTSSSWRIRMTQILLGAVIVIVLVVVRGTKAGNEPAHLTKDWSQRHLVFSPPRTMAQRIRLMSNPRYMAQLIRRNAEQPGGIALSRWRHATGKPNSLHTDWSQYLGYNGDTTATTIAPATAGAGNYPAKYSYDATTANCADVAPAIPDFVVYNTGLTGSATAVAAVDLATVNSEPAANDQLEFYISPAVNLSLFAEVEASPTTNGTGLGTYPIDPDLTTEAANIAAAINLTGNGSLVGVSATSAGNVVTVAATTPGTSGNSIFTPATSASITWSSADVPSSFEDGGTGIPSIMAFDNLYSTCPSSVDVPVPTSFWSFDTGGQVLTSPTLSGDGTQVAFVQNVGATSNLILLKWSATSGANFPTTLTSQASAAAYQTCAVPCMFSIPFSTANGGTATVDSNSSPFYDFTNDALYVGNDNGFVHKFSPVFNGPAAEITSTSGPNLWPASVSPGNILTSPVFDDFDGTVYVADNTGVLYRVDSTIGGGAGGVVSSAVLGTNGIQDPPVVDETSGDVYVFVQGDEGATTGKRAGVFQFGGAFTTGSTGTEAIVSSDSTLQTTAFHAGDFDNTYYNSPNATGNLYVCSTNGGLTALWQIPIIAGVMGAPVAGPTISSANVACSPVTEFFNPNITSVADPTGTDFIFLSVTGSSVTGTSTTGNPVNCPAATTGCLMSFDITSPAGWNTTSKSTSATAAESGGTSGIIVDGSSSTGGASQVYLSPLGNGNCTADWPGIGGCAVQASQSGLD